MIHLDTNYLIAALKGDTREARRVDAWCLHGEALVMSSLAWAEFLCGSLDATDRAMAFELLEGLVPVGVAQSERAAALFHRTGRRRHSLTDCVIAASAIEGGAALATSDVGDFRRFVPFGLQLAG